MKEQLDRIEQGNLLLSKDVLTIDDVAMLTGFKKSTLYKMTFSHRLPFYKPNGKTIFFKRSEITDWLLQNRRKSVSEIDSDALRIATFGNKADDRQRGGAL